MKKLFKIKSFLSAGAAIFATTLPLIAISCSNSNNNQNIHLTKDIVAKNVSEKGIWNGKTRLTYEDLKSFKEIDNDAFDIENINFDFIELPSNIVLSNIDKKVDWSGVNLIKIKDVGEKNLTISSNILFSRDTSDITTSTFTALTISNRVDKYDLVLPTSIDVDKFTSYSICENFYDENIFQNIEQINFTNSNLLINYIGTNAFKDCNKISDSLNISISNSNSISSVLPILSILFIKDNAFENSSITGLSISLDPNLTSLNFIGLGISISDNAFRNCSNLLSFRIWLNGNEYFPNLIDIGNSSFSNCENLKDIFFYSSSSNVELNILDNCFSVGNESQKKLERNILINSNLNLNLTLGNSVFSGNYSSFKSLIISSLGDGEQIQYNFENSFKDIRVDLNNFIFIINKSKDNSFKDVGFTQIQEDKFLFYEDILGELFPNL